MKGRSVYSLFSKNLPALGVRAFTTGQPPSMVAYVWLPAIKKRDESKAVISRVVLSSQEAKRRFASKQNKGVDPWGHASLHIKIDGSNSLISPEIIESIQECAIRNKVVSLRDSKVINSLEAYLSWYPDEELDDRFTDIEKHEWLEGVSTGDQTVDDGKAKSLPLFTQKYSAYNSTYLADINGYGQPDYIQNFSRGLNFTEIIKSCFSLMKPVVKNNIIVMESTLPTAVYYGMSMLREHRLASKLLTKNNNETTPLDKLVEPMHVCTTANIFLFKAGLGDDRYYEIVRQIFTDHPELGHGFPITDFTYIFLKALSQHPDYRNEIDTARQSSNMGMK